MSHDRFMRTFRVVVAAALLVVGVARAQVMPQSPSPGGYSIAVTRICAGAVLFEHRHRLGTRAGAHAIARDIRASTARRLTRIAAVPVPPALYEASVRWISLQIRLAASYARAWVGMYEAIDAARTPAQQASLVPRLGRLVHAADPLKLASRQLEQALRVPDCTGGG